MKNVKGWMMPDHDLHFEKAIVEGEYQKKSRDITLKYVKDYDTMAIDVGANIGFWTKPLCEVFTHVHAFEPFHDNRDCLIENVPTYNYTLHPVALGNEIKENQPLYSNTTSCGAGSLDENKAAKYSGQNTNVFPLDTFNFTNVGYMKIDVQGTEKEVIQGSLKTLENNNVVLVVELPLNPGRPDYEEEKVYHNEIQEILSSIGYKWQKPQYKKEAVFLK
jgi:FkbM family methyltransferase